MSFCRIKTPLSFAKAIAYKNQYLREGQGVSYEKDTELLVAIIVNCKLKIVNGQIKKFVLFHHYANLICSAFAFAGVASIAQYCRCGDVLSGYYLV